MTKFTREELNNMNIAEKKLVLNKIDEYLVSTENFNYREISAFDELRLNIEKSSTDEEKSLYLCKLICSLQNVKDIFDSMHD